MEADRKEKSNIARRRRLARENADQEYVQRRALLLQNAGKIFREKGYESASMSDFAKVIGIDRASIYYYISSKEELFQEISYAAVKANVEMIERIQASDTPPAEKIRAFVIGLMKSYEEHYPYLYVYVQEDMARIGSKNSKWAKEMRSLADRFDAASLKIIQEGIDSGSIDVRGGSAHIVAFGIVGMCNWSHRWFRPTGKVMAETIGRQFADMILSGVLPR